MRTILAVVLAGGLILGGPAVFAKGGKGAGGGKAASQAKGGKAAKAGKPTRAKERKEEMKAFKSQEKAERKAFKQSLKDKTPEERKLAMQQFNQQQLAEKKAFYAGRRTENMAALKERLAKNPNLTDEQRAEIASHFEAQQDETVAFNDQSQAKITEFMGKIGEDQTMTPEQRKSAIQDFFSGIKKERLEFFKTQKQENQALQGTVKPADGTPTPSAETDTRYLTPSQSGIPGTTTP